MSSDLNWNNHNYLLIASQAYIQSAGSHPALIPSGLDTQANLKKLVRHLSSFSTILLLSNLEASPSQRLCHARKIPAACYQVHYHAVRLQATSFDLKTSSSIIVMQLELNDIMFFIRCLKTPADTITSFSYVHFSSANTRSTTY